MSFEQKALYASLPRVKRGAISSIKGDPKGKTFLYTNGKSVFIRNVENPSECDVYTQHAKDTYVAAYAPSGFYIASGDASGKIRIWDTTQKEHILKYEYQPLSATVKDIAWSPDSKRLVVVGEGREKFGCAILWDSGSTVGKIDQHTKAINAVDYRSARPFRVCTASEDFYCNFYEGPPFKYKHALNEHSNFVNCVKYSPNGDFFVSGGADGRLFVYDGKDGQKLDEVGTGCQGGKAHAGGIYGVSWSPDGASLLTASADKTCKIWNIADKTVTTYDWYELRLGHFQNITAVTSSSQKEKVYSASFDGRIIAWDSNGSSQMFKGKGHSNEIRFLAVDGDTLISCAIDDTVRFTSLETQEYGSDVVSLGGQPMAFCIGKDGLVVVGLERQVLVIRNKKVVSNFKVPFDTSSVSVHPGQSEVAVGSKNENRVYIYNLDNDTLVEKTHVEIQGGNVLHVGYSPDGAYLGVSTEKRKSYALKTSDYKDISGEWYGHTGRIFGLQWSPDSQYMATCGLDTHVFVHQVANPKKPAIAIK
ncbi:hypothetical protein QZH41_009304, partial [Actinostola sp. cb2023]